METSASMDSLASNVENTTLATWIHEFETSGNCHGSGLFQAGTADYKTYIERHCKEWFRVFNKISNHFPSWFNEPSVKDYVISSFPMQAIEGGMWQTSSTLLSQFFGTTLVIFDEEFHLQLVSSHPEVAWILKGLPKIQDEMPTLNSLLILLK